jgi:poly-gamma-glutamate synthesis protein (capsule biosynthesis protein)
MLNILLVGDFAPCRGFEKVVLKRGKEVLGDALPFIKNADLSFINLECPLTFTDRAINKEGPALKADPACVSAIKDFSVVGLANNHILDFGRQGIEDTLNACSKHNIPTVGAGLSLNEAQNVFVKDCNGTRVAIIAIAEHEFNQSERGGAGSAPIDLIDNHQQIEKAKSIADIVILTLHGGNEYFPYPRPSHRKMMQHFIDLGVDAVICHHPHVPGGYEIYNGKPIVYSLGNFVFDTAKPPEDWNFGYMAHLSFDRETRKLNSIELIPYEQSVELQGVKLLEGQEKDNLLSKVESYRKKLNSETEWLDEWQAFVNRKTDSYILKIFFPFTMRGLGFLARNTPIAKLFFNKKNSLSKLNALRCQSHRELLIAALESRSQPRNDQSSPPPNPKRNPEV